MRKILLNPGPATTSSSVKKALVVDDICPREKEFGKLINSIRKDLVKIAGGDKEYSCVLFAGSGTAAMESCMCSVVPNEHYAAIISNGAYGERFSDMASIYNIKRIDLRYNYNERVTPRRLRKYLESIPNVGGTFVTHHETTTGVLNNIKEICYWSKDFNVPSIVDAISSFGCVPIDIKKINADFVIGTSNKCLQGMPGISFVIGKKESFEKCRYNRRSMYLDLYEQWKYMEENNQFQFTPAVQVLYAFRQAIDEFLDEGVLNRQLRYSENWNTLINGMKERGFKRFLTNKVTHSEILETFYEPKGFDFDDFHDKLYAKGFTIYPGKLTKEKTFRVSVMGDIDYKDIKAFLEAVDEVMK